MAFLPVMTVSALLVLASDYSCRSVVVVRVRVRVLEFEVFKAALVPTDGEHVEHALCRVGVTAVAAVDDRHVRPDHRAPGRRQAGCHRDAPGADQPWRGD